MKDTKWIPQVGEVLPNNEDIIVAQVYSWNTYYDISVTNKLTGQRGFVRVMK